MKKESKPEKKVNFQVIRIQVNDPDNSDIHTSDFVGPALMSKEKWEKVKDLPMREVFSYWPLINDPYNPFEDDDNAEAHRHLTNLMRNLKEGNDD